MQFKIKMCISASRLRYDLSLIVLSLTLLFSCLITAVICDIPSDSVDDTKSWNATPLDRLHLQLFTNYDKNAHPTTHSLPSNITLGMTVNYIDIEEMDGKITLHAWLKIGWLDENRSWSYRDYDNIKQIHLRPDNVWKPQISLFNSAGDSSDKHMGDTGVVLAYDGSFTWVPPVLYTAYCSLNLQKWPYDEQVCRFNVGSWTQTYIEPHLESRSNGLDYSEVVQTTEWEITKGLVKYVSKDYYNYIEFTFNLKRRSSMYAAVIYTPATCIILLSLSTFWLPPQMGEKIMLNGVTIVIVSAFLMYFAQLLPILATNTPLIVLFYSSTLLMLSISTVISVTVLYLSTAQHKRRVPDFVKYLLNGPLGSVLLLKHFALESEPQSTVNNGGTKELSEHVYDVADQENYSDPLYINPTPGTRSIQFDWILLATALDRIFFILYCITFAIFGILYEV